MPVYTYRALSPKGASVDGQLAAHSLEKLRADLLGQDLILQSAREKRSVTLALFNRYSLNSQHFYLFNQELIALLRAGIAIPAILELLSDRPEQLGMQQVLRHILSDVREGSSLSKACSQFPDVFDGMFLSSLKIGEKTGDLVPVLKRYQEFLRLKISLTKKIQQAMAYPVFLMLTMVVILFVLFSFVLPRFVAMYTNFDAALPAPTSLLINLIEHSYIYIPAVIVFSVLAYLVYRFKFTQGRGRLLRDKFLLKLPLAGSVMKLHIASQVSRTLATLIASGMTLVETISTTADSINNQFYALKLHQLKSEIQAGESFSRGLEGVQLFPPTSIKMIQAAEMSGELESMLTEVALYHEETLEYSLTRLMSFIEPLLILLMGVFIGGIILVMYLPIFSVADIIK